MCKKRFTLTLFANISNAFDTVTGDAIIKAMEERGISQDIIDWYQNYISNRIATVKICRTAKTVLLKGLALHLGVEPGL